MAKGCEEIPRQGKDLHNIRTLRKVVAIYKTNRLCSSFQKIYVLKNKRVEKNALLKKVAIPDLFSVTN